MKTIDNYIIEKLHLRQGIIGSLNENYVKTTEQICRMVKFTVCDTDDVIRRINAPKCSVDYYVKNIYDWVEKEKVNDFIAYISKSALGEWKVQYPTYNWDNDKIKIDKDFFSVELLNLMGDIKYKVDMHGKGEDNISLFIKDDLLLYCEFTKNHHNLVFLFSKKYSL